MQFKLTSWLLHANTNTNNKNNNPTNSIIVGQQQQQQQQEKSHFEKMQKIASNEEVNSERRAAAAALTDDSACCKCGANVASDVADGDSDYAYEGKTDASKSKIACNRFDCEHSLRNDSAGNNSNNNNTNGCNNSCHSNLSRLVGMLLFLFFFSWCDLTNAALTNVNLFIEPPAVRRGQPVALRCQYTLEGAPLYSVKFYRGSLEFFRYTPGEYPNTKVFQYPAINVDENISNATQVVLRNVSFLSSGNFSCEVTADAPLYSTATAYAHMQVVELPEKRPQLFTDHTRYEPGETLRANCSTPPSRPRADLRFTINNIPVSTSETQYIRTVDNLIASRLSLKLQLQGAHFAAGANAPHLMNALGGSSGGAGVIGVPYSTHGANGVGGLVLRCTAQIGDFYQEYKEIELGTPQKDPVPARVTLSSGSSWRNFIETYFSSAGSSRHSTPPSLWQRQALSLSAALLAVGAFHWLQLGGACGR